MITRLFWVLRAMLLTLYRHKFGRNWREIEIKENSDSMVQVPRYFCNPFYFNKGIKGATEKIYLRNDTYRKYVSARDYVKDKYDLDLIIYDGYRPYEVQEYLFWLYMKEYTIDKFPWALSRTVTGKNKNESFKEYFYRIFHIYEQKVLIKANRSFVSLPSKDFPPSPHITGGAIDVWLHKNGKSINLGCKFDYMHKNVGAFYFFLRPWKLFFENLDSIKNRNIIIEAMTRSGFAAYGPEFWHYSYGDQMWALVYDKPNALYGAIEPTK